MKKSILLSVLALALAAAGLGACDMHKHAEEQAISVKLADCPKPVRDTLAKEAPGVAITAMDKEDEDGKVIYEADAMMGGKNYEIKIDADGTLVSKKLDDEAGEKKDGKKGKD